MGIVYISVLFWIVFDHFIIIFAPNSVIMTLLLASCLEGSKVKVEGGRMLEMPKKGNKSR